MLTCQNKLSPLRK